MPSAIHQRQALVAVVSLILLLLAVPLLLAIAAMLGSLAMYFIGQEASVMKSLASPSFFRLFDLLISHANPGLKSPRWTFDGVEFERERHSFIGPKHGVAIEIFTLTRGGRRGWALMVTKEYWWAGEESKALKSLRWARATSGQRSEIMGWLRAQAAALDRPSKPDATGSNA